MLAHLILTFVNLLFLLFYALKSKHPIYHTITEVLNHVTNKEYEFSEWALTFVFLLIIIPCATICMILITFKIYTHDFIKPIQKSYLVVVHSYLTCLMFCKLVSDILLRYTHRFSSHTSILYDIHCREIMVNVLSFNMFFIVFVFSFFFAEAYIASVLNSIPLKNMGILKKNLNCIIFCSMVLLCYSLIVCSLCYGIVNILDSKMACLSLILIGTSTALITNIIFFLIYIKSMMYFTNMHARIYREFIAI